MIKYIKETIIGQADLTEIDFQLDYDVLGKVDEDDDIEISYDPRELNWNEGDYLEYNILMGKLKSFADNGATHFQIYPHCDHHGYYITGVKMEETDLAGLKDRKELEVTKELEYQKELLKQMNETTIRSKEHVKKLELELKEIYFKKIIKL